MQISPIPSPTWTNPAAASQQASSEQRSTMSGGNPTGSPSEAIVDVERSTETLDRDANGQYDESPGNPKREETQSDDPSNSQSMLELPAECDSDGSALDLMG